jgi:hypothetical protein
LAISLRLAKRYFGQVSPNAFLKSCSCQKKREIELPKFAIEIGSELTPDL